MLIDFHTHAFPEKIAAKAMEKLSLASGGLNYYTNGTSFDLMRLMNECKVSKTVVLSIATNAEQQKKVNDFAVSINNNQNVFAFGSVFPDAPDVLFELERIKDMGLKGVKLHPDYQRFNVDDPKMKPIYKKIGELGLVTVFHAGQDFGFPPPYGATPQKLEKALWWFSSPVIAAHFGGIGYAKEVLERLCGKDVYIDTSFSQGVIPRYYAQKIIEAHGADKIVFGSDCPWHTPSMELKLLDTLEISQADFEKITHKNAERLLGI